MREENEGIGNNRYIQSITSHVKNLKKKITKEGKDILSCKLNSLEFSLKNRMSMAAPHVAGLTTLIIVKYPGITLPELKEKLANILVL